MRADRRRGERRRRTPSPEERRGDKRGRRDDRLRDDRDDRRRDDCDNRDDRRRDNRVDRGQGDRRNDDRAPIRLAPAPGQAASGSRIAALTEEEVRAAGPRPPSFPPSRPAPCATSRQVLRPKRRLAPWDKREVKSEASDEIEVKAEESDDSEVSGVSIPASPLMPVDALPASLVAREGPEIASSARSLLTADTPTRLSREDLLAVQCAMGDANTIEEVQRLEQAVLDGVLPEELRGSTSVSAGDPASTARPSVGSSSVPVTSGCPSAHGRPFHITSDPWFELREEQWYCCLCWKWATPGHVNSDHHAKRVRHREWHGYPLSGPLVGQPAVSSTQFAPAALPGPRGSAQAISDDRHKAPTSPGRGPPAPPVPAAGKRSFRSPSRPPSHWAGPPRERSRAPRLPDQEEAEDLEEIPMAEKVKNPLRFVAVIKNDFRGHVVDIERGVASGVYLYRVRYKDGDCEHFTEQEIRDHLDPTCTFGGKGTTSPAAARPSGKRKALEERKALKGPDDS